jgi:sugar lactone lactonase YvrE
VVIQASAPELVANFRCEIGENPLWHADTQAMIFLDIPPGKVHAYSPAKDASALLAQGRTTGGSTIQEDGSLLLFQDGRISILSLNSDAQNGDARTMTDSMM